MFWGVIAGQNDLLGIDEVSFLYPDMQQQAKV
jgi:hypothetical protein